MGSNGEQYTHTHSARSLAILSHPKLFACFQHNNRSGDDACFGFLSCKVSRKALATSVWDVNKVCITFAMCKSNYS
eukprot:1506927-Amphidinium_carterae.1